jgi:hypothetical protein
MRKRLNFVLFPGLLAACLCCATLSFADSFGSENLQDFSSFEGLQDIPAADLSGWLLDFNPANEWTTPENIAIMESWLKNAGNTGADPLLLEEFDGPVMNSPGSSVSVGGTTLAPVPEPATLGLLCGALVLLAASAYVSLRRFNRSRGYRLHIQE